MDDGSIADQRFIPRGSAVHHMERARCTDCTMERRDAVGVGSSAQKKQRQQGVQCWRVGSEGAAACFPLRILYDDAGWSQQSRSAGDRLPSRGSRRSGPTAQREKKTFFFCAWDGRDAGRAAVCGVVRTRLDGGSESELVARCDACERTPVLPPVSARRRPILR